jgi:hypothetical protein
MSGEEAESRSERLRRRRGRRARDQEPEDEVDVESEPSAPEQTDDNGSEQGSGQETGDTESGIKKSREGTYMYLTEEQKEDVDRLFKRLRAKFELEFDDSLEKNRHFYPLLVQHGLEGLDGLDASDLRDRLDDIA